MAAILSHLQTMAAEERKDKVAAFAADEPSHKDFLRQHFPDLYREVFGPSAPAEANSEKLQ
jgi:hypothetical protein